MLLHKISNRKLCKLGVGLAFSTSFFLTYLVYSLQMHRREDDRLDDVIVDSRKLTGHGQGRQQIMEYDAMSIKSPDTTKKFDRSKLSSSTSGNYLLHPAQHSSWTRRDSIALKKWQQTSYVPKAYTGLVDASPPLKYNTHRDRASRQGTNDNIVSTTYDEWTNQTKDSSDNNKNMPNSTNGGRKYVIYSCQSTAWCGGWGDRQRGIISVYILSLAVGREFKIVMSTPCNLSKFYVPHKVSWSWDDPIASNNSNSVTAVINDIHYKSNFRSLLLKDDFNTLFPQDKVYISTNRDYYSVLRKNPFYAEFLKKFKKVTFTRESRFKWAWAALMQPSGYLLDRLQDIVGSDASKRKGLRRTTQVHQSYITKPDSKVKGGRDDNSSLICAHVRMGRSPTIPMDEYIDSIKANDIPMLQNFLQSKDEKGNANFFIATDSDDIRMSFRNFFGDRIIGYGGKILHIDRQRRHPNACLGLETALLDQLILSVCDVLVVSRSGFSIHAAYLNNNSHPTYIMEEGKISTFKG